MRPPSGRAFDRPGLEAANRRRDKNIDVLNRRTQKMPKIPPPVVTPPSGGGGIVGQAEIYSVPGTVGSTSGGTSVDWWNVRWDAPYDPSGLGDPSWAQIQDHQIVLEPGSYIATLSIYLSFATQAESPERFDVVLWGGDDIAHLNFSQFPALRIGNGGTAWGLNTLFNPGPFYATKPVEVQVQYGGSAGATKDGSFIVLVTKFS
jgi:hypothetical protein